MKQRSQLGHAVVPLRCEHFAVLKEDFCLKICIFQTAGHLKASLHLHLLFSVQETALILEKLAVSNLLRSRFFNCGLPLGIFKVNYTVWKFCLIC